MNRLQWRSRKSLRTEQRSCYISFFTHTGKLSPRNLGLSIRHSISLSDLPPVIKVGEFDTMVFKIQTPQEGTVPSGLYPSPAIYDLTLLLNQLLLNLHDQDTPELSVEWVLRVEERLALWMRSWSSAKQTGGRIDLIVGILYDW